MRILLYLLTAALYGAVALRSGPRHTMLIPIALHAALLYSSLVVPNGLDLGLANSLSAIGWLTALMYWTSAYPLASLQRGVAAVAALCSLAPLVMPPSTPVPHTEFIAFKAHLVIAMLAYSLFAVAALQALVMTLMERRLHSHALTAGLQDLPPLLSMEQLLFRIIGAGFVLLTLTLISGMVFSDELFGQPLALTHKVVFAIASWIIFALLLCGRLFYGWRGRTALHWVLAGFAALLLAYLGTKFALEIVLER
jgi:ABC-type uncharacterized transport system permease subunit